MMNKPQQDRVPLFHSAPMRNTRPTLFGKIQHGLIRWRIHALQERIEAIQDALDYEMRQDHSTRHKLELVATARQICADLNLKQKRLQMRC